MATVNPYLLFNGNCEEAFLFYKSVFGGEFPYIGKFKDMPVEEGCDQVSAEDAERIMHVSLPIGSTVLMGSDSSTRFGDLPFGENFSVSINTESTEEADRIFNGLSAGGKIEMPLNKTFWGAYFGMFKDKFGINWMVNFDENQKIVFITTLLRYFNSSVLLLNYSKKRMYMRFLLAKKTKIILFYQREIVDFCRFKINKEKMAIEDKEIILLKVSGHDKIGVTAGLTAVLATYDANILDIGQADIHDTLSLGILFEIEAGSSSAPVLKDLLFKAYELEIKVKFIPISIEDYEKWVKSQSKQRYIINILGEKLAASQLAAVTKIMSDQNLNIDSIIRLTGRTSIVEKEEFPRSCIQLSVTGEIVNKIGMTANFMEISRTLNVDISFQEDNIYRRNRRLVCFDMDSTLIQTEVIDELAELNGVGPQVRAITESAMNGEIDFNESFKQRMALLEGLSEEVLQNVAVNLPITQGAHRLMKALKYYGYKTAILSGGFSYFGEYLQKELGIDYVHANQLEIKDGKLTGKYIGDIVDGQKKAEHLKAIAEKEGIHINQTIAVGDGANDLPMLNLAGLGIAFHAKPKVKESASTSISSLGLDGVLYLLGYHDRYIDMM